MSCDVSIGAAEKGMSEKKSRKKVDFPWSKSAIPFGTGTCLFFPTHLPSSAVDDSFPASGDFLYIVLSPLTVNLSPVSNPQPIQELRLLEVRDYNDRGVTSLMRKAWAFFCRKDFCSGFFVMESHTMVNISAIYSLLEQLFHISKIPPVTNCFMLLK